MDGGLVIRLMYGVLFVSVFIVFLLSRRHQRNVRLAVNGFAFAFARLANLLAPRPIEKKITPDAMRAIAKKATGKQTVALYGELADALEGVLRACGRSPRYKRQFAVPIQDIFDKTRNFLILCENIGDKFGDREVAAHKGVIDAFLGDQAGLRSELLKRISGDAGDEYLSLNAGHELR